jgi:hypothetical protein
LFSACAENGGNTEGEGTRPPEETYEMTADEFKATGRLYFGKDKNGALLMDDNGVLVWVYPTDSGMLESYDTGDRVTVVHGPVMLSYPGQTNISSVSLVSDGDESAFSEEELAEIMKVVEGFR